ncbi:hypothetical protein GGR56DRAFT_670930 [Xylariaceae sp. FL0804]|nr:hypothetical protein GGR56DRAFT_670930 [Xylariaceae sp. FL0804]
MSEGVQETPVPVPSYGQPPAAAAAAATAPDAAPVPAQPPADGADVPPPVNGAGAAAATSAPVVDGEASAVAQTTETGHKDVTMVDANTIDTAPSPAPAASSTNAPSPAPARTGTPLRASNGPERDNRETGNNTSRAASQHPEPGFTLPAEAPAHGVPVRQYLNSKVTTHVLEGMKQLAKEQPKDPLRVLGDFLIERSKQFENQV